MSYSRWSNSRWYTFWTANGPKSDKKDDQAFEICDFGGGNIFLYKQLNEDLEKCLDEAVHTANLTDKDEVTDAEREELATYMKSFMEDIEEEYKK